ncbi:hypothetical protein C8J56DRAFT_958205 [Mycena floridula]|nr:hypothetical protein C8J56DRAFT_958205 [Mycena floridula]
MRTSALVISAIVSLASLSAALPISESDHLVVLERRGQTLSTLGGNTVNKAIIKALHAETKRQESAKLWWWSLTLVGATFESELMIPVKFGIHSRISTRCSFSIFTTLWNYRARFLLPYLWL